jgi:predicted unusual protein kinase regulating ubiquinone biosynthesis (AarF/ABC1/UbiB family)
MLFGVIFAEYLFQMGLARLFGAARCKQRSRRVHRRNARRLYRGILRLRGVYIKMGQVLSVMGSFLPKAYTEELEGLQDQVPARPMSDVERTFLAAHGKTPQVIFEAFETTPLAAASLGQVHRARYNGEVVAVKILYPNIQKVIALDLRVLGWVIEVYSWFMPMSHLERVIEQLRDLLGRETNLEHEARCLERIANNFKGQDDVLFPKVYWELTTREILVMTFMEGIKISHVDELNAAGIDPEAVAKRLVETFYKQLFVDGFFHADPHPGNFLVQRGPKLVVLDFGAVSEVRPNLVDGMLDILKGMFAKDDKLVWQGIETMGFVSADGNRALLERTVKQYFQKLLQIQIDDYSRIKSDTVKKLADPGIEKGELRELMRAFEYPEGWFFVERSVVILFGLVARIAPKLNTVQVGFPYAMRLLASRMAEPVAARAAAPVPAAVAEPPPAAVSA